MEHDRTERMGWDIMAKTTKTTKHAGGRPRTKTPVKYSKTQLQRIDEMARAQAKDSTIACAMGIGLETFRREFRERTEQKRAEGKLELLQAQRTSAIVAKIPVMQIWAGKQHLGQSDKKEVAVEVTSLADIAAVMRGGDEGKTQ